MAKDNYSDGICDSCGNTGLAGEKCPFCGDILSKIEVDLNDPLLSSQEDSFGQVSKEPETYSLEEVDKEEIEKEDGNI